MFVIMLRTLWWWFRWFGRRVPYLGGLLWVRCVLDVCALITLVALSVGIIRILRLRLIMFITWLGLWVRLRLCGWGG